MSKKNTGVKPWNKAKIRKAEKARQKSSNAPLSDPDEWAKELDQRSGSDKPNKIIHLKDAESISAMICDVGESMLGEDHVKTLADFSKAIAMIVLAWNLSLFPEEKRNQKFNEFILGMPPEDIEIMGEVLAYLIKRKIQLYPNVKRMVVDYKTRDTPQGFHVDVASTV